MIREEAGTAYVEGPMTLETASTLTGLGKAAVGRAAMVFDLAAVSDVDSSGLAVVFDWVRSAKAGGANLKLINAPKNLISLAAVYGVGDLLPLA